MTIVGLDQIARQLAVATQPQSVAPTLTRRQGVISAVNAGPPVSVDVTVGGVIIPGVKFLATYVPVVSDVVFVDFNGPDPLVIGTISPAPSRAVPGIAVSRTSAGTGNTASTTNVDLPGPIDTAFTKRSASTYLDVTVMGSAYCGGTNVLDVAIRINGVDYDVCHFFFNVASSHGSFSGSMSPLAGLAAGSYTARLRWRSAAAVTMNVDQNDLFTVRIQEINPT